jgi:CRP/FNR family cyclic AMP-dependent transcriptional regulator
MESNAKTVTPPSLMMTPSVMNKLLNLCHIRKYPNKTAIFRPGDSAGTLYYIVSGSVTVLSEDEEGRELILAYLNKGDFIGELGLFTQQQRREVIVRSRTPCELAEIGYERLFSLFENELKEECPRLLFAIGAQLTHRVLQTSRKVSRLAFMDVTNRISRSLLDLCREPDAMSHPQGTQIRVSRQEISRIVGCSREMVGRVLKQLETAGTLSVKGKTIVIFGTR